MGDDCASLLGPNPTPCGACFEEYEHGAVVDEAYVHGTSTYFGSSEARCGRASDLNDAQIPRCSGLTRVDGNAQTGLGALCRRACARSDNYTDCRARALDYCVANSSNYDCKCLKPEGTSMGVGQDMVAYGDLVQHVAQNPGLGSIVPQCLYKACNPLATRGTVIPDPELDAACPETKISCSVSGLTVSLKDVQVNNLNVVTQRCGSLAADDAAPTLTVESAFWDLSNAEKVTYGIVAGLVLLALVAGALFYRGLKRDESVFSRVSGAATSLTPGSGTEAPAVAHYGGGLDAGATMPQPPTAPVTAGYPGPPASYVGGGQP